MTDHLKPKKPLLLRLSDCSLIIGLLAFGTSSATKEFLPHSIALLPALQLSCAFLTSVLIPFASILALGTLLTQTTFRRTSLFNHLVGPLFTIGVLCMYFFLFLVLERICEFYPPPNMLPKLAENARTFPSEEKRSEQAKWAYRFYGVTLAYRRDDLQSTYYQPSAQDLAAWESTRESNAEAERTISFIQKFNGQLPYLVVLYASTFSAAYLAGGILLLVRLPRQKPSTS